MVAGEVTASRRHEDSRPHPAPAAGSAERPSFTGCIELACLHGRLPAHVLAAAALRSERLGIGADRVLIAAGTIGEEDYVRALARHLGVPFVPLDLMPPADCAASDEETITCAATGLLRIFRAGRPQVVAAPRGLGARGLCLLLGANPSLARDWSLTTGERFTRFVLRRAGRALADHAANRLRREAPELSAAPPTAARRGWISAGGVAALLTALFPVAATDLIALTLGAVFLGWLALRLAGVALPAPRRAPWPPTPERDLPVYTVLAALYREAASVDGLLHAIAALDYPREKLDVILAVEADDGETRAAIAARGTTLPVTVIPLDPGQPRTKPRALNAALPFARGAFAVVFDAEDRPDPDQLRCALTAFAAGGDRLGCVQARLTIDNTQDSWLTRGIMAQTPQEPQPANPYVPEGVS